MKPEEFTLFSDKKPEKNKWLIVTNNITAKNAHSEMSHVWLTDFWQESKDNPREGIITFDATDSLIYSLTHWKYA